MLKKVPPLEQFREQIEARGDHFAMATGRFLRYLKRKYNVTGLAASILWSAVFFSEKHVPDSSWKIQHMNSFKTHVSYIKKPWRHLDYTRGSDVSPNDVINYDVKWLLRTLPWFRKSQKVLFWKTTDFAQNGFAGRIFIPWFQFLVGCLTITFPKFLRKQILKSFFEWNFLIS